MSVGGLYFGADFLIKGSVQIANYFKISKMVIALTLVAAGTSMPEFFVTLLGTLKGNTDISVGNIVGSNIANITLVLGIACVILPFSVKKRTLKLDYPIVLFTTALFFFFMQDKTLSRIEGIILFVLFIAYILFYLVFFKRHQDSFEEPEEMGDALENPIDKKGLIKSVLYVLAGVALLYAASEGLIRSAVFFALKFGVPERVIGVSMVAVGTSIPEIFTSMIAAIKKESDISLGNVLGSNFLNIAMVISLISTIKPLPINPSTLKLDALFMIGTTLLILPLALYKKFTRFAGVLLLAVYASFIFIIFK